MRGRSDRPLLIEVIGPPGSGKSTLIAALTEADSAIVKALPPYPRSWSNVPFYAGNLLLSFPVLASMLARPIGGRRLSRSLVASVVVLRGWHRRLTREHRGGPEIVLLDQGPLYLLADLHGRGPLNLLRQTGWWENSYRSWAATLDGVIRLDADDTLLLSRIRQRGKEHRVKQLTDAEGRRHLSFWRGTLSHVLTNVAHHSSTLKVLSYDSSPYETDALAEAVLRDLAGT